MHDAQHIQSVELPWPIAAFFSVISAALFSLGIPPALIASAACGALIGSAFAPEMGRMVPVMFLASTIIAAKLGIVLGAAAWWAAGKFDVQIIVEHTDLRDASSILIGVLFHPIVAIAVNNLIPAIGRRYGKIIEGSNGNEGGQK